MAASETLTPNSLESNDLSLLTNSELPASNDDSGLFPEFGSSSSYNHSRISKLRQLHGSGEILHVAQECAFLVRLIRSALRPGATVEDKRLSWEIIKSLRAERREDRRQSADVLHNDELARAIKSLMPVVNIQVNNDSDRHRLEVKAENGLTQRERDRARRQLQLMDEQRQIEAAKKGPGE